MIKHYKVHSTAPTINNVNKEKTSVYIKTNIKRLDNCWEYDELILTYEEYNNFSFEDYKKYRLDELEHYINELKETGIEIDEKPFKCDDECKNNLTQCMVGIDFMLPLTWFTRNGEMGTVTFTTKEEFMQFALQLASKLSEIQNKYYAYKYAIENATNEEELNAIVFE